MHGCWRERLASSNPSRSKTEAKISFQENGKCVQGISAFTPSELNNLRTNSVIIRAIKYGTKSNTVFTSHLGYMTANVQDKDKWESIRSISRIHWHSHGDKW